MFTGTPTSTLLSEYQKHTRDTSSANQTNGQNRIQYYYTYLLSEAGNYTIERTKYGDAKDGQRSYFLPPDYIKMKSVRFLSGGIWYQLEEVRSIDKWNVLTGLSTESSIPAHWIVINEQGRLHLELDPIPDTNATDNLEIVYEGMQDPLLFPADYTTGTITISNGDVNVAGSGTTFTSAMVNRFIKPTNGKYWYEIRTFTSTIAIALVNYFQETGVTGVGFTIAELMRLPAEFHYTPMWAAVRDYYLPTNRTKAADYEKLYVRDLLILQKKYQSKSKGRVIRGKSVGRYAPSVPLNYPKSSLTQI